MNDIKWFYCFNADSGDFFEEIEHDIPESPSHDELDAIAQELLIKYGYTDGGDYVCIGKGKRVTIEAVGSGLGDYIIETLEDRASDIYGAEEDLFSAASREDIKNLDSRIEQALREWEEERNIMSDYHTIPDVECYYYHGDNKEEQE